MLTTEEKIYLKDLDYNCYLNHEGKIDPELEGKIAIYAIYDRDRNIQYIGYTRNLFKSLQQHLIRKVDLCYWFKNYIIERPNRAVLEGIRNDWLAENEGLLPNEAEQKEWTQPIDTKEQMTEEEKEKYAREDELHQGKILKKSARRVEGTIEQKLRERGVTMNMRFNPKLKEEGLLDLK